jgi:TetR/AcrR family transcriptional repressor of nem operon
VSDGDVRGRHRRGGVVVPRSDLVPPLGRLRGGKRRPPGTGFVRQRGRGQIQDRRHDPPFPLNRLGPGEPLLLTVHDVVEKAFIGIPAVAEDTVEVDRQIDRPADDAPPGLLGLQGNRHTVAAAEAETHEVGLRRVDVVADGGRTASLGHRKMTTSGRRTRDRIVQVAADLMFIHGVAGTSIPDVQGAAQVSASQIYHYFGDKSGLVRAVIDYQIETSLDAQRPILDKLDSFDALRAWCEAAAHDCIGGCEIGSLASELAESDDETRADLVRAFDQWEAPIRKGLARMQERGELTAEADVPALATAMLAAIQGGLLLTQLRREPGPFRQATSAVIGYIETFAA